MQILGSSRPPETDSEGGDQQPMFQEALPGILVPLKVEHHCIRGFAEASLRR